MNRLQQYSWCKIVIIGVLVVACSTTVLQGQDIHFSQFNETPMSRNPALAGLFEGDVRAQLLYRNQWGSVTVPYQTASASGEYKFPVGKGSDYMTAGLQVLWDKAGTVALQTSQILPVVNFHKSLSEDKNSYLSLGFIGGFASRRLDRSKVTTDNQYGGGGFDPSLPDGEAFASGYNYFDVGVGMSYNASIGADVNNNYYIGLAYHHLNRPGGYFMDSTIYHFPKWVASAGLRTGLGDWSYITLSADYSLQGSYKQLIGGAMFSRKIDDAESPEYTVHLGTYFRWEDAIIPVVKLDYNKYSIGFSYDMNISTLRTASRGRGGVELSFAYRGFVDSDRSSKDILRCPRF